MKYLRVQFYRMDRRIGAVPVIVISLCFILLFAYCTGFGLSTRLGYDDVMNLSFAAEPPLHRLLFSLAVPFTNVYRPAGSAAYLILFEIFGLRAPGFRAFIYFLLLINIFQVYALGSRLARSKEIGVMGALLYVYHGRLTGIYLNNGTLYDVLCAALSLATLNYYTGIRERNRLLRGWEWITFILLFVVALNAKEMAAAIPGVILCYELFYHGPSRNTLRSFGLQALPTIVSGTIAVGATWAKTGEGSVMHGEPAYRMTISASQFLDHWRLLMTNLVYAKGKGMNVTQMLLIWLVLVLMALVAKRKRYLAFSLAFALLAPMPVVFIPFRGFFVMYLPLAGWTMLIGGLLIEARDLVWSLIRRRRPPSENPFEPGRIVLFVLVAFFVAWIPRHDLQSERVSSDPGQAVIAGMRDDILLLNEPLPKGAKVLFRRDRFPADAWGTVMISRLLYHDKSLWADRPTMMKSAPDESVYDRVFDYANGRLVVVKRTAATNNIAANYPK